MQPSEPTSEPRRRRSRLGLFLPYVLLLLVVALWSAGWFWARGFATREMDAWIGREAAAGRAWTCADRSITGYPFRLELRCSAVRFARSDGRFSLGPTTAVLQIYDPRHVVLEASGPFHTEQGELTGDVSWSALEASFHGTANGFSRVSLVVDAPKGSVTGAEPGPIDFAARHLELHARPTPARFESEGAVDASLRVVQAAIPQLDDFVGNPDPADIALDATLEQATVLRTETLARELETWRQAGGSLDVALLSLAKGARRLQAQGAVGLDERHRPAGQFEIRAAGLESVIGQVMGQKLGKERGALIGNLVGQLLGGLQRRDGGAAEAPPANRDEPALKPLPPLRLADGRLMLGPIAIPNVVLPPLY